jgi:hypothetical protein
MLVAKVELQRAEGVERSPIEADVLLQSLENELAFIDRYLSSARHLERFMSEEQLVIPYHKLQAKNYR